MKAAIGATGGPPRHARTMAANQPDRSGRPASPASLFGQAFTQTGNYLDCYTFSLAGDHPSGRLSESTRACLNRLDLNQHRHRHFPSACSTAGERRRLAPRFDADTRRRTSPSRA